MAAVADRVVILYLGQVAEHGPVDGVLTDPHFPMRKGLLNRTVRTVRAVNEVSFDLWLGETMGLVGESGCGKTTLAQTLIGLIRAT